MQIIRRLLRYYSFDIILAFVFLFVSFVYVYDASALASAIARKVGLASAGLVYYYITRYIKVGVIDWEHPYDKIYAVSLLFYIALVFALG